MSDAERDLVLALDLLQGWCDDFDAGWCLDDARALARMSKRLLARLRLEGSPGKPEGGE